MAEIINPNILEIDMYVSFSCNHPTDETVYEGKIKGIVTYDIAKTIEADLIPYYREVAKQIPDIAPYSTLKYLVLEYTQGTTIALRVIRAVEWINLPTLKILEPDKSFDIRIYNLDMDSHKQTILDLLKANGYLCDAVKKVL